MPPTAHRLTMRKLTELSLVDNPANQYASAVIAKRMAPDGIGARLAAFGKRLLDKAVPPDELSAELAEIGKDAETYEDALNRPKVWEKFSAMQDVVQNVMNDDDMSVEAKREKIDAALSAFRDDILSVTKAKPAGAATCSDCGSTMENGACPQGHGVKKGDSNAGGTGDSHTNEPIPGAEMRTAQTFTDVAKANEHIGVLTKALNDSDAALEAEVVKSDPLAIIVKGMTPAAADAFKKMHDRNAALEADRLNERFVSKADKILKGVASDDAEGKAAALAVVKTLAGVATDAERATAETFISKLAAQNVELAKELDGMEVGGGTTGTGDATERSEELTKAARELMKSDKTLTLAQAVSKALENDPDLYDGEAEPDPATA